MVNTSITKDINILSNKIKIYFTRDDILSFENAKLLEEINLPYNESLPNNRSISISMRFSNYINVTYLDSQMNESNSKLIFYP